MGGKEHFSTGTGVHVGIVTGVHEGTVRGVHQSSVKVRTWLSRGIKTDIEGQL